METHANDDNTSTDAVASSSKHLDSPKFLDAQNIPRRYFPPMWAGKKRSFRSAFNFDDNARDVKVVAHINGVPTDLFLSEKELNEVKLRQHALAVRRYWKRKINPERIDKVADSEQEGREWDRALSWRSRGTESTEFMQAEMRGEREFWKQFKRSPLLAPTFKLTMEVPNSQLASDRSLVVDGRGDESEGEKRGR